MGVSKTNWRDAAYHNFPHLFSVVETLEIITVAFDFQLKFSDFVI